MNCREAERLIDTFYDGELDGRSMRDAALHITRCKRCETELNERERLQKLVSSAIEDEIADVDLSRIWAAVEPTLGTSARGLPGLRAAAGSRPRVGGLLGGHRAQEPADELDPASWDAPPARAGRPWGRWSLAGGAALAASVLLALALVPDESPNTGTVGTEVARATAPSQVVAPRAPVTAGNPPFAVASAGVARAARGGSKQVQVESVNFPRSSVAMWSEPASDTTVIWIGDEELAASGRR